MFLGMAKYLMLEGLALYHVECQHLKLISTDSEFSIRPAINFAGPLPSAVAVVVFEPLGGGYVFWT